MPVVAPAPYCQAFGPFGHTRHTDLRTSLTGDGEALALLLFRERHDTKTIAGMLRATEAAVASIGEAIRDRERAAR
jgi:hypothetical protein